MKDFKWENLQETALKRGQLVYAFDQERPVEKKNLALPDNGYCVGLTLRWIALRFAGKDYEYNAKGHLGLRADFEALRSQYKSRQTPGGPFARAAAVLRDFGISTNPGRSAQLAGAVSADMLINATRAHDGLYYIEMRGKDETGKEHAHALAIQRDSHGAGYRFFDSNEGHFVLKDTAHFKTFLIWFLNSTPYKKEYLTGTWIVGVNPPAK